MLTVTMQEQRLKDRNTETPESLRKRLDVAKAELEYGNLFTRVYRTSAGFNE
jgi:guanylate kinase